MPGYIYGYYKRLHTFDGAASFLPFTAIDRASYGPGRPFTDLKRPYHEGYQRDAAPDDGTQYAAKKDDLR